MGKPISRRGLFFAGREAEDMATADQAHVDSLDGRIADPTAACLSFRGIACRLCEEACDPQAIRFRLLTAGRAVPLINAERCTGCGACLEMCPEDAFDWIPRPQSEGAAA